MSIDGGAWEQNEIDEDFARWLIINNARLIRTYGDEGFDLIAKVQWHCYLAHPGMPEKKTWAWAEEAYARGDVLC